VDDPTEDRTRLTVTVRADLVEWLRAKAQWQQRSMSSIVEDGLSLLLDRVMTRYPPLVSIALV
jgi:hypothetical protein